MSLWIHKIIHFEYYFAQRVFLKKLLWKNIFLDFCLTSLFSIFPLIFHFFSTKILFLSFKNISLKPINMVQNTLFYFFSLFILSFFLLLISRTVTLYLKFLFLFPSQVSNSLWLLLPAISPHISGSPFPPLHPHTFFGSSLSIFSDAYISKSIYIWWETLFSAISPNSENPNLNS